MKGRDMMKKNLEEMQVKVANKRAILESHDGEEFSPITVAKNVLCEDGTTMQDYFDNHSESNISTKIVNSNSMSKVGQGDSVDFSDNVMNGAYEDVVLKGKSLVNVIQGSSKDKVVLPYSFEEGEMVTINDTHENGRVEVEVKGRTLVNLASPHEEREVSFIHRYQTYMLINDIIPTGLIEGELIYMSMEVNIHEINIETPVFSCQSMRGTGGYGLIVKNFDELEQLPKNTWVKISTIREVRANQSLDQYNLQLGILGEHPTESGEQVARASFRKPMWINLTKMFGKGKEPTLSECDNIPYFEGMTSVQTPTIQTCGKNLSPINDYETTVWEYATGYQGFDRVLAKNILVDKNVNYRLSFAKQCEDGLPNHLGDIEVLYSSIPIPNNTTSHNIVYTHCQNNKGKKYAHITMGNINKGNEYIGKRVTLTNIQLEEGSTATTYERYQSSSLTLPEEIVLRGLPNGVCDTYNTKTKEYTQRIGEVVLDGSEERWELAQDRTNTMRFNCYGLDIPYGINGSLLKTDKLPYQSPTTGDQEGAVMGGGNTPKVVSISIMKAKLSSSDIDGFKQWLSQNPITVQYELATPIITKIDLPSLKTYNTVTHLSSTVGEGSLVPTLASDDTVSYPVVIKPNTKYSIIANSYSNNHTNSAINFNLGGATNSTTVGSRVTTITTPSTLSNELLTMSGRGNKLNNVMVIEGDVVGDEPYFEGICDCKSPILSNVGKNLFDGEIEAGRWLTYGKLEKYNTVTTGFRSANTITITPSSRYTISGNFKASGYFVFGNKDGYVTRYIGLPRSSQSMSFNTNPDECYGVWYTVDIEQTEANKPTNIQLEEASTVTPYEPYKTNILSCETYHDEETQSDKIIVLRSLSNGVCDTLNVNTGEYVQRVKEVVYTGEENWMMTTGMSQTPNNISFYIPLDNHLDNTNNSTMRELVKDNLGFTNNCISATVNEPSLDGKKGFSIHNNGNVYFTIPTSECANLDVWKSRLRTQPLVLQYPVKNPIIKQVNVGGYPYAYENGHISLESGSQEQSLTPTIEYSIVANRGGQIRSNQRMVERHQKKLDSLYAMTLVNMIDSQYKQVLMKLKSELGSEVTSWDI